MSKWTVEEVERALAQEVATILSVDPTVVKPDVPFHSLGMESLGFVELLVFVENTYGLALIDAGLNRQNSENLRALARYVCQHT